MKRSNNSASGSKHDPALRSRDVSDARLVWSMVLNLGLTAVEVVVGMVAGSLMLIADALHNFSDSGALLIALIARRISRRKADRHYTFGYRRAELIGAIINLTTLIVIALYLIYEAVLRLISPQAVDGAPVMIAAAVVLVVDVLTAWLLWDMSRGSLNVKAAFIHNVSDALTSIGVLLGGAAILLWGWTVADPIITIVIAVYVLTQSSTMFKRASAILMNRAPADVDTTDLRADLEQIGGVVDVHHVHVWEIDERARAMEAHVVIDAADAPDIESVKRALKNRLHEVHGIDHCTLEFELVEDGGKGDCPG